MEEAGMTTILVDGVLREVAPGQNLLQACLGLGLDLPYFCWHPAMGSIGACRQCAVKQYKDEHDTRGRLVMACMTPAVDGARIVITDPEAHAFRRSITEWMMLNHPHDCPVCDEGGECHLQDMVVMTGHTYRRYRGQKRTFVNQDLGPFVNHEMNRCIQCYRCVRFYREYAGGRDFDVFAQRSDVYFGRQTDGVLENEFSGNLVEVCPTGVFDDKTLKEHYTRKWDLQTAPSVCVHCSLGCNTLPGERSGVLRRVRNRYNGEVNGYFLCDRGRYGYEFVNSEQRIRHALVRDADDRVLVLAERGTVPREIAALLSAGPLVGIGSPRASLESNFALRTLVGAEHFYAGVSEREWQLTRMVIDALQDGSTRACSLREAEAADAVLILGEDLTNTAPRTALAIRQSVRHAQEQRASELRIPLWDDKAMREAADGVPSPLFIATPSATKLDDVALATLRAAPDDIARLGCAVAHVLDPAAPPVSQLTPEEEQVASRVAEALAAAQHPLVVSGTSSASPEVLQSAVAVARALTARHLDAGLCLIVPSCNSLGLALLGGDSIEAAFRDAGLHTGGVVVLENDLYRHADSRTVDEFLRGPSHVVVLDHLMTRTGAAADAVLPAATFAEADGTLINNEGRAQRFFQVCTPDGDLQESWRWLRDLMVATEQVNDPSWRGLDDVVGAIASEFPSLAAVTELAPPASFRIAGQKVARESSRSSGRTALHADVDVHELRPPDDPDSALSFSMEGYQGQPPAALVPRFWAPGWNSIQALNKFQEEIAGPLRGGDPGRRLIVPSVSPDGRRLQSPAVPFERREGEWLIVPLHHIFGSEELSSVRGGVAELAPEPYLALNRADAALIDAEEGEVIGISVASTAHWLPLRLVPSLPDGVAGVPVGLRALPFVAVPAWARLMRLQRGAP
jgi:NADH-quinone oxidoreductase subunit G